MTTIVGIDPGRNGALTFIDPLLHTIHVYDMPTEHFTEKRWEVLPELIADMIIKHNPQHGVIEDVWSMTGDGNVGAFSFGCAFGMAMATFRAHRIAMSRVRPTVWKANFRVPADKVAAIDRAVQLIPALEPITMRKKDDGRAESAILALYACFYHKIKLHKHLKLIGLNNEEFFPTGPSKKADGGGRDRLF